jgi:hypothetical protein
MFSYVCWATAGGSEREIVKIHMMDPSEKSLQMPLETPDGS